MSESEKNNKVAIVGFFDGSAGQVETWFEEVTGYEIACFVFGHDSFEEVNVEEENSKRVCKITEFPQNKLFKNKLFICSSNWVEEIRKIGVYKALCLEPSNKKRQEHINLLRNEGIELVSAIHPSAIILPQAKIHNGVWINAGAIIGYKTEIESGTIVNTGAQIDHHNIVEECCQIDPSAVTAGNVVLRNCCHIHTGATVINRRIIGENSIVGAGSVVIRDVEPNCTVIGVPARVLK